MDIRVVIIRFLLSLGLINLFRLCLLSLALPLLRKLLVLIFDLSLSVLGFTTAASTNIRYLSVNLGKVWQDES
jgi:hypothetical protein